MYEQDNNPKAFALMTNFQQTAIQLWVALALRPSRTFASADCGFSYGLKHRAEEAIGISISNGEMKGAMLAQDYDYRVLDDMNWEFNSSRRCPHRMGARGHLRCPFEGRYVGIDYGPAPALCQATVEEVALFEWLRDKVRSESIARKATG